MRSLADLLVPASALRGWGTSDDDLRHYLLKPAQEGPCSMHHWIDSKTGECMNPGCDFSEPDEFRREFRSIVEDPAVGLRDYTTYGYERGWRVGRALAVLVAWGAVAAFCAAFFYVLGYVVVNGLPGR